MNTILRSLKPYRNAFIFTKKTFSSSIPVNLRNSVQLNQPEAFNKLLNRDEDYFNNLSKSQGVESVIETIHNLANNVDVNTKLGREVILAKNDMLQKIAYQNRTIEEHENVSRHICESELFKVYKEHLKYLEEQTQGSNVTRLVNASKLGRRLLYENPTQLFRSRQLWAPLLTAIVPSAVTYKYSAVIKAAFGASAPTLLYVASLAAGYMKYKSVSGANFRENSRVASSVEIEDEHFNIQTNGKMAKVHLSNASINYLTPELNKETGWVIKDRVNNIVFFMPDEENTSVDHKYLEWLKNKNGNKSEYDIDHVLSKGVNKLIDVERTKRLGEDLETMARLKLLALKHPKVDLTVLTKDELYNKMNLISDEEVRAYLNEIGTGIQQNETSKLIEVENFFTSLGLSIEDAANLTKHLSQYSKINSLKEVQFLSYDEVSDALRAAKADHTITPLNLKNQIDGFFSSLNSK